MEMSTEPPLEGRVGLARGFSLTVEIPYISHDAFTLDGFIASFHRAFGLRQVGRTELPNGSFVLMFQPSNGAMTFDGRRPRAGVGDVSATLSWRPSALRGGTSYGLDLALKAPTGSARDYNGSGSWDGGLRLFVPESGGFSRGKPASSIRGVGKLPLESLLPPSEGFSSAPPIG